MTNSRSRCRHRRSSDHLITEPSLSVTGGGGSVVSKDYKEAEGHPPPEPAGLLSPFQPLFFTKQVVTCTK